MGRKLVFRADLAWDGKSGAEVTIAEFPRLRLDMPTQFGGERRSPCPDEFFLSSVGGCLLTTFLYFARKLKLRLVSLEIPVFGEVKFLGAEGYRISHISAQIRVKVNKSKTEDAKMCVELTRQYCHITRSIDRAFPIQISSEIRNALVAGD